MSLLPLNIFNICCSFTYKIYMHEMHNLKNNFLYIFVSIGGYVHTYAGAQGGQQRAGVPLELKLQTVVSHQL